MSRAGWATAADRPECERLCEPGCAAEAPAPEPPDVPPLGPDQPPAPSIDLSAGASFGAALGPAAAVPGMLGDSYIAATAVEYSLGGQLFRSTFPYGGRYKCADNTGPLPTNRVSFAYKHFHNALESTGDDLSGTLAHANRHVDSYTLGIEKAFLDDWASLEVRVPFYAGSVINQGAGGGLDSSASSPGFGNLSLILKLLWSRSDTLAVGGGLGIDLPTAADATGRALGTRDVFYDSGQVYLAPFVAFLATPNDRWWWQGVVQFSFVSGRNTFFAPQGAGVGGDILMRFKEQDLAFVTLNAGRWLFRNPQSGLPRGIAGMLELNYTATLEETALVSVATTGPTATLANFANHQNVLNLSAGLHLQLTGLANLRVAAVVPLRGRDADDPVVGNRYFDSEVSVQFNRHW